MWWLQDWLVVFRPQGCEWFSRATGRRNWSQAECLAGLASGDPGGRTAIEPVLCPVRFHSAGRGHNRPLAGLGHAPLQSDHRAQDKSPVRWRSRR